MAGKELDDTEVSHLAALARNWNAKREELRAYHYWPNLGDGSFNPITGLPWFYKVIPMRHSVSVEVESALYPADKCARRFSDCLFPIEEIEQDMEIFASRYWLDLMPASCRKSCMNSKEWKSYWLTCFSRTYFWDATKLRYPENFTLYEPPLENKHTTIPLNASVIATLETFSRFPIGLHPLLLPLSANYILRYVYEVLADDYAHMRRSNASVFAASKVQYQPLEPSERRRLNQAKEEGQQRKQKCLREKLLRSKKRRERERRSRRGEEASTEGTRKRNKR